MAEQSSLSDEEMSCYQRDGFFIRRKLFNTQEISHMAEALEGDPRIKENLFVRRDTANQKTRAVQWNNPGKSSYGIAARTTRVVNAVESLLGGEVYHWQSKVTAKDAREGGAWEWHQDYGYWYDYGCLYPDMCSVMVGLDKASAENGCLRVLKGSHKIGRLNHVKSTGNQINADPERVTWAKARHEEIFCELDPGDSIFFHCNLLHSSGPNTSNLRRWALIFCYNLATNDPFAQSHNPNYRLLTKVNDSSILQAGTRFADGTEEFQSTYVKANVNT